MRLSEDKISHISHLLINFVLRDGLGSVSDEPALLKTTKRIITQFCRVDDEVDALVRKRLASYSKTIPEGSREWDILYKKHFEEELSKRWR